ncbi:alpha/beta hydrolase [Legionella jordanis]|uniref:Carboxylesterase/phospholipase n=1 Tax=Legionella jordanis TaxID=456 RepID=A0A0W0VCJ1_9GAMM|nr:carboxylesterase/phospholipase [Legionella jordanis]VEH11481.1 carboxylesterase/phospholipase [Legionella jordanis]
MLNAYIKEPPQPPEACIIWMHGLGADANDMSGLASQLQLNSNAVRHVFLDAPVRPVSINNGLKMRAWYDIYDLRFSSREDREGILDSENDILAILNEQIQQGIPSKKIWLAGFSQGGAMALHTALKLNQPLGGIIVLSAYLPLASECKPLLAKETAIFFAYGLYDSVVLPDWSKLCLGWLKANGYLQVAEHSYPMDHAVCLEEIEDLSAWLNNLLAGDDR